MKTTWTQAKNIRPGESIETTNGVRKVIRVDHSRDGFDKLLVIEDFSGEAVLRVPLEKLLSRVGPSITSRSHPDHPKDCLKACCRFVVPPPPTKPCGAHNPFTGAPDAVCVREANHPGEHKAAPGFRWGAK